MCITASIILFSKWMNNDFKNWKSWENNETNKIDDILLLHKIIVWIYFHENVDCNIKYWNLEWCNGK